jgi:hypothetical protein
MRNTPSPAPSNIPAPSGAGKILLYRTEDGKTRLDCRFEERTIGLTQALIAKSI